MIDWQLAILRIERVFGLTDAELARKVGCHRHHIADLKRAKVKEPRYTVGVELKRLWEKADGIRKAADELGQVSERQA